MRPVKLYAIRKYYHGAPSGYVIGPHGPVTFTIKRAAEREAKRLKALAHAPGRDYRAELRAKPQPDGQSPDNEAYPGGRASK